MKTSYCSLLARCARMLSLILVLSAATATSANAQVRDLSARVTGSEGLIRIAFNTAPTNVTAAPLGNGVRMQVAGVAPADLTIESPPGGLVRTVRVSPMAGGVMVDVEVSTSVVSASGETANGYATARLMLADQVVQPAGPSAFFAKPVLPSATRRTAPRETSARTNTPVDIGDGSGLSTEMAEEIASMVEKLGHGETDEPTEDTTAEDNTSDAAPAEEEVDEDAYDYSDYNPIEYGDGVANSLAIEVLTRIIKPGDCALARHAVEADPWMMDKLWLHGACLAADGEYERAEEALQRLLMFEPTHREAQLGIGAIRAAQGEITEAAGIFTDMVTSAVTDAEALRARSLLTSLEY